MVDFGRFGLVGSVCVLCCDGAERSVLVLLRLGFVRVGLGILMATMCCGVVENGDFVIVFCATCLLLYVYYFFFIL